jgi:predicted transcriptional regulator of viral defense system
MELLRFFEQHPVFTHGEFVSFLKTQGTSNPHTQRELLAYHLKKRHVIRIRRGFYGTIPPSFRNSASNYPIDPFLIAGRITEDAVLAYHTALDFHGVSYSVYHRFTFMSQQKVRPFIYQCNFICLSFPRILCKQNKTHFEVIIADRQGLNIKVTSLERTIVDVLDQPNYAGGFEEIWQSAAHIHILNLNKVVEYALLLNNATSIAKLGFFLEEHKELLSVDEDILKALQEKIPNNIHYLERHKRESGKLIKRWNLVVPHSIIKRTWEELNNDSI